MRGTAGNRTVMGERIRVLVADDHRLFAESLTIMLEVEPSIAVVGQAADGREAVALAAILCPDVVVMDLDMPVMDGIEATAGVRRSAPGAKVVIVTGSRDHRDAERAREAGAAAYVPKEASVEQLRETVCEVGSCVGSPAEARRQLRRSA
jgi:DNA-binding NarL/FixJ family response regulator